MLVSDAPPFQFERSEGIDRVDAAVLRRWAQHVAERHARLRLQGTAVTEVEPVKNYTKAEPQLQQCLITALWTSSVTAVSLFRQGTVVTEVEPVKNYTEAEPQHQQYLASGGRFGQPQSPAKVRVGLMTQSLDNSAYSSLLQGCI